MRTVALCALILCLSGCIVLPIPTPTHTTGPKEFKGDVSFIQAGSTTRAQILEKLGWANAGLADERVFLGRWGTSSGAVIAVAGGINAGTAGGWRMWEGRNVMVEFDENEVVRSYRVFDDPEVIQELAGWAARAQYPPLDLAEPLQVWSWRMRDHKFEDLAVDLRRDTVDVHLPGREFRFAVNNIEGLRASAKAESTRYRVEILGKSQSGGKPGPFELDAESVMTVIRYLRQVGGSRLVASLERGGKE